MLVVGLSMSPASAHERWWIAENVCSEWSFVDCGKYGVSSTHRTAKVCDLRSDGVEAWVRFERDNGKYSWLRDPDGNGGRCGYRYDGSKIVRIKYCAVEDGEIREGCLSYKYIT